MPDLSIKDVSEELAEALRQRAARNRRSLQGELMAIITAAAAQSREASAAESRSPVQGVRRGTRTIEETAAALRALYPEPVCGGPLAVDILRADRDSR
jgi:plasmid stability protein